MQEKKETLTMGNSGHTAMGEGARPTIEQKDAVQAFEQQKQMEDLLNADDVVCAHVYDSNGYSEFLFRMSVENIANFLGARPFVQKMILTDSLDRTILCTIGFFTQAMVRAVANPSQAVVGTEDRGGKSCGAAQPAVACWLD